METKEIKIEIPEGYEIDKEKSTFENIVFKKKPIANCWKDLSEVSGVFIQNQSSEISNPCNYSVLSSNRNIFLNKKYAKSALALAQISQLLPYYDSKVDWCTLSTKWVIERVYNHLKISQSTLDYYTIAFNTYEEAERFLKYNEQLIKDYYMMEN